LVDNNFIEEDTPVLGELIESRNTQSETSIDSINSWEEEKTILIDDDDQSEEIWLEDQLSGNKIDIVSYPFTIGRSLDADFSTQHGSVSRKHALITKTEDSSRYLIEDLGSSNGIKVNGVKTTKVILSDADVLMIGSLQFTFRIKETDSSASLVESVRTEKKPFLNPLTKSFNSSNRSSLSKRQKFYGLAGATVLAMFAAYQLAVGSRVQVIPIQNNAEIAETVVDSEVESTQVSTESKNASNKETSTKTESTIVNMDANRARSQEPDHSDASSDEQIAENGTRVPDVLNDQINQSIETKDSMVNIGNAQAQASIKSPIVEPAPEVKKVIRRSSAWSENYIQESLSMYLAGDAVSAEKRLGILSRSARHQQKYREQSANLAAQISQLQQQFITGKSLSQQGRRNEAFIVWQNFLMSEKRLFPNKMSTFAKDIQSEVAIEYTSSGNIARQEGRWHDAYNSWQKASTVLPTGEAANSLRELKERAKRVYLDAYLQEKVNIQSATVLWQEVMSLVPSGNEYNTKAKAKLRLYENYGKN